MNTSTIITHEYTPLIDHFPLILYDVEWLEADLPIVECMKQLI